MAERLAEHTTLRLGGPADAFVRADSAEELVALVGAADHAGGRVLVLGGGSNLVAADSGFAGTVVKVDVRGIEVESDSCGGAFVTVGAGETWDDVVARAITEGWVGIEALSGIPGSVGATPIQNVGAYGQEVAQTIARVRVWDRLERTQRTLTAAECGFGYRWSRFKATPERYLVLDVTFQFRLGSLSAPVRYAELARTLGVEPDGRAPLAEVRDAVLGLRRGKGMVLDADDHDTWSAGSFFTNPVVPTSAVPEDAPSWPQGDGTVKTSAAWLIDHAGFGKGYVSERVGPEVSLSTKHTLALTNRGGGTAAQLLGLAREIRDGVEDGYGIRLVNEPVLLGATL